MDNNTGNLEKPEINFQNLSGHPENSTTIKKKSIIKTTFFIINFNLHQRGSIKLVI